MKGDPIRLLERLIAHPELMKEGVIVLAVQGDDANVITNIDADEVLRVIASVAWSIAGKLGTNPMDVDQILGAPPFEALH